jgi:hypothetical protein
MMTLECLGVFAVMMGFAAIAGLAMSYRNGKAPRQAGSKAKPVHKVTLCHFGANFCRIYGDSRNIIAWRAWARY